MRGWKAAATARAQGVKDWAHNAADAQLSASAHLATNDTDAWHNLGALLGCHLLDGIVAMDDAKNVEQLALILVNALDLQ